MRAAITNCRNTRETIEKCWIVNNKNSFVWPSITHQDICVSSYLWDAWSFYCRLLNKSKKKNIFAHSKATRVKALDRILKLARPLTAYLYVRDSGMNAVSSITKASTVCWAQWVSQQRQQESRWCTQPWTHRAGCDPKPWQRTSIPLLPAIRRYGRNFELWTFTCLEFTDQSLGHKKREAFQLNQ